MKKPTLTNGLYEAALQQQHTQHKTRLAELARMRARLGMLDAFVPALKAAGLPPLLDALHDWAGKEIYIRANYFTSPTTTQKLVDVLVAEGMQVVERRNHTVSETVVLAKGRLRVAVSVDLPRDQKPSAAPVVEGSPA